MTARAPAVPELPLGPGPQREAGLAATPAPVVPVRPWRVLELTTTTRMGGTERSILELVGGLDRRRFEPVIASLLAGGPFLDEARARDIPAFDVGWQGFWDVAGTLRLFRFLRRECFDLVQIYGLKADLVGRPLCRLAGIPVLVSSIRSTDPWRRWHHVLADRLTSPLVDLWISNSEAGRRASLDRERRRPETVVTVPTGLDLDALRPGCDPAAVRRGLGLPPGAILVGQVANLRPMKGHREVIEAIPAVVARHPEAYFIFAGRDELGGALGVLARALGIESRVRFLGYCPDTTTLIAAFDLVLLPSRWEGLPVSILEAMALGKPVLATAVGGIPELVSSGETGLLIPEPRPELIAAAVNTLLADRAALARMGARATDLARRRFTRERMVAEMESIYLRLLRRARRRIP